MSDRLSEHFTRAEFACRCGCGFATADPALIKGLEAIRASFGRSVVVLSGCRCVAHNAAEGGAPNSQHILGRAADIRIAGVRPMVIYREAVRIPQFRGFGVDTERGFIHLDTRAQPALWTYRNGRVAPWRQDGTV